MGGRGVNFNGMAKICITHFITPSWAAHEIKEDEDMCQLSRQLMLCTRRSVPMPDLGMDVPLHRGLHNQRNLYFILLVGVPPPG